jgi:hypothetical protein
MSSNDPRDLSHRHLARVTEWSDGAIVAAAEAIGRSIRMIIPTDRQSEEDHVLREIRCAGSGADGVCPSRRPHARASQWMRRTDYNCHAADLLERRGRRRLQERRVTLAA